MNLYTDPIRPTQTEVNHDAGLIKKALAGDTEAAYELGAREAKLSCTTNLDGAPLDVGDAYEKGRKDFFNH